MSLRAHIKYVTKNQTHEKPYWFTTGAYSVKIPGTEHILYFDWMDLESNAFIRSDGKVEITSLLRNFDTDLYESSNKHVQGLLDIPLYQLSEFDLVDVNYDCYLQGQEDTLLELELVEFVLIDDINNKFYKFAEN